MKTCTRCDAINAAAEHRDRIAVWQNWANLKFLPSFRSKSFERDEFPRSKAAKKGPRQ